MIVYAFMQACGVANDHFTSCPWHDRVEQRKQSFCPSFDRQMQFPALYTVHHATLSPEYEPSHADHPGCFDHPAQDPRRSYQPCRSDPRGAP
ncbi:MAG: hypothetical protein AAGK67_17360 [Pseudomonadota bacterium]